MTYDIEKTKLQQISDVAWLVHQGQKKIGILNKDVQEHFTYINGKELVSFSGEAEVKTHFGNATLFEEKIETPVETNEQVYIKGYEVDFENPALIDDDHPDYRPDLPLYAKLEGSNVYYAAGYYCLLFEKGWMHSRGPKLATLEKYRYEGPFKTKIEMRQRLKELKRMQRNLKE